MGISHLKSRVGNPRDELYTFYDDIENQIECFVKNDNSLFRDKTVYLPCDDPRYSNFVRYFLDNFSRLGLKKLVSTSYAGSPVCDNGVAPMIKSSDGDDNGGGRLLVVTREDVDRLGQENIFDVKYCHLDDNGDFRSDECEHIFIDADFIITNPPFSLITEFLDICDQTCSKYLIIAPETIFSRPACITRFMQKRLACGHKEFSNKFSEERGIRSKSDCRKIAAVNCTWIQNIDLDIDRRELEVETMEHNILHNRRANRTGRLYKKFDDNNAINCPTVSSIPSDYDDWFGVPITIYKYNFSDDFVMNDDKSLTINKQRINGQSVFKRYFLRRRRPEDGDAFSVTEDIRK